MKESIVPAAGQFDEVIQIIQTSHDRALKDVLECREISL